MTNIPNHSPRVWRLDADMNGTKSIQPYIDAGTLINLECPTFSEFDAHRLALQKEVQRGDFVILDTVSTMLSTTRSDRQLGSNSAEPLWEPKKIDRYFGDKEYLAVYNMAGQLVLRGLKNLRARGANIIAICHEDDVKDAIAGMTMSGPKLNPAMVNELTAASSDVFRLVTLTNDRVDSNGTLLWPADTRVLYLRRSEDFTAKFHVPREFSAKIPRAIPNPTMPKLWKVLHGIPEFLTIYGFPGTGKTSLAATVLDSLNAPTVKTKD